MATQRKTKTTPRSKKIESSAEHLLEMDAKLEAISKSQACIEFKMDGTILTANDNFLQAVGYTLEEIQGRHHSIFVEEEARNSDDYRELWAKLNRGEYEAREFKRIKRNGDPLWIQASYNPLLDLNGAPFKVVKFATDITEQVAIREAAKRAQQIIEDSETAFMMVDRDFQVTYMNEATRELLQKNLHVFREVWPSFDPESLLGGCIDQFHADPSHQRRMLADPGNLPYRTEIQVGSLTFNLNVTAVYDAKGSYAGNTLEWKDITDEKRQEAQDADFRGQLAAIHKANAVIEFDMDGTILSANENFLSTVGYRLDEIQGRHHGLFVTEQYRQSTEYREFWAQLNRGEYASNEYLRVGKGGKEIWIQASYNPIFDTNGKPFKVVKYATDITAQKLAAHETTAFVAELGETLTKVAQKDLTARVNGDYTGDHATTKDNLNNAVSNLEQALGQIGQATGQLTTASRQINQGSAQVAQGASVQASSIEEISASLEEMSAMTAQSADNAMQASSTANTAAGSVAKGTSTMNDMQAAIQAIKDSSTETAKIVKTIDEISFQTNMLALNAAVEAARAGDAGKGFAVVAEEVRALAQRSAEAAKMTAQLIEESSKNATSGVEITGEVQNVLGEIDSSTMKVKELLTEMSAASKEQAEGIGQINSAVDQMNKVTQENAANSEQSSAAAGDLDAQINQVSDLLGTFCLSEEVQAGGPPPPPSARPVELRSPTIARSPAPTPQDVFPLDDDELSDF